MRTIGEGRPQGERVPPAQEKREQSREVVKVLLSPDCCGREGKVGGQVSYSPSRQEQRVVWPGCLRYNERERSSRAEFPCPSGVKKGVPPNVTSSLVHVSVTEGWMQQLSPGTS